MSLVEHFCQQSNRTKTEVLGAIALLSLGVLGGLILRGQPKAILHWLSGASTGAIALVIHRVVTDQQGRLQLKITSLQGEITQLTLRLEQITVLDIRATFEAELPQVPFRHLEPYQEESQHHSLSL